MILELELFKSNKELVLVISKLNFPHEPILWCELKHCGWIVIMGKNATHQNTAEDWKI